MTKTFFNTMADGVPVENVPRRLCSYLEGVLDLQVSSIVRGREGSLKITVEYRSLETLECLWKDCSSGHLKAVAEKSLVTNDIRRRLGVEFVKLKATILKGADNIECKSSLMGITGEKNQWGRNKTYYKAITDWAPLPTELKKLMPKRIFKYKLKQFLLDHF